MAAFALDPPRTTMISSSLPSAAPAAAAGFKDRGQRAYVPNGPPNVERKISLQLPGRPDGQIYQSLATEVQSCNHRGTLVFGKSRSSINTEYHHSILQCYHRAEVVQANLREPRPSASMPTVFGRRKPSLVNSACQRCYLKHIWRYLMCDPGSFCLLASGFWAGRHLREFLLTTSLKCQLEDLRGSTKMARITNLLQEV
jgi:hypothetical protein